MERNFILHLKTGNKVFSEKEVIENALEQERNGIEPHYSLYDHSKKERITNPGWLVWSCMVNVSRWLRCGLPS